MVTRQFTFTGKASDAALSPDGKSVAYVSGGRALVVQPLEGGEPRTLVPDARFIAWIRWTRDGSHLVFIMFRDSTELAATYGVPVGGGTPRKIVDDQTEFDTGPDTASIIRKPLGFALLEVRSIQTGELRRTVPLPDSLGEIGGLHVSPDGRWLAAGSGAGPVLIDIAGGSGTVIRLPGGEDFAWSASGDTLYFLSGIRGAVDVQRVSFDARSRRVGPPVFVASFPTAGTFDRASDGTVVVTETNTSTQATVWSMNGSQPGHVDGLRGITQGTRPIGMAAVSEDGSLVAYSVVKGSDSELEVVPFGGAQANVVGSSPAPERFPRWAPDGSLLAFLRGDSLMVGAPRNDASPRWLRGVLCGLGSANALGSFPGLAWSADGRTLGCLGAENGHLGVVVADARDGYRRFVSLPDSLRAPLGLAFSPDGRELILSALVKAHDWWALWRTEIANGPWRRVPMPFGESYPVRWNPDGWLYVVNDRALSTDYGSWYTELWRIKLPHGRAEYLNSLPVGCGFWTTISRDARRGACTLQRTESDIYVAAPAAMTTP